ncbi:MAG: hypothetical protein JW846_11160 [Dehalococcoidia bacterium]|nr:hypothetical protein [Dehalococcoidia bacterium]
MIDLTVDVCVLMSAATPGANNLCCDCGQLLQRMTNSTNYVLAVDDRDKIATQYREKCKFGTPGHHFYINMVLMGKVINVPWRRLNQGIKVQLNNRGFTQDTDDYKYVVVAQSTNCRTIATHDRHFAAVESILRRLPVYPLPPSQA